jgi:hypothetical protein
MYVSVFVVIGHSFALITDFNTPCVISSETTDKNYCGNWIQRQFHASREQRKSDYSKPPFNVFSIQVVARSNFPQKLSCYDGNNRSEIHTEKYLVKPFSISSFIWNEQNSACQSIMAFFCICSMARSIYAERHSRSWLHSFAFGSANQRDS